MREDLSLLVKTNRFRTETQVAVNDVPDIIHILPVNEKSLDEMERWLDDNAQNKKLLVRPWSLWILKSKYSSSIVIFISIILTTIYLFQAQELSRIGGSTVKEVTRRIMYRVFTNEVGILYSWEGAKKKKPFKKLTVASTIPSTYTAVILCKNLDIEASVRLKIRTYYLI